MLDIVALVVAAVGFYTGYSRGLIKTVFGIVAIILGILISLKASPYIISFIEDAFKMHPKTALIVGFILTLGLVIVAINYFGKLTEKFLKTIQLNFANKLAGGIIFSLIFLLLLGMAEKYLTELEIITPEHIEQSVSYPIVTSLPNQAGEYFEGMRPAFNEFWEKTKEAVESGKEQFEAME